MAQGTAYPATEALFLVVGIITAMEISDRLTPAEIEQLRRDRKEIHEFCQELFSEPKPDQTQKPYHLTPSEIDSLRREMKASSDWVDQELRRRYPNRIRTRSS